AVPWGSVGRAPEARRGGRRGGAGPGAALTGARAMGAPRPPAAPPEAPARVPAARAGALEPGEVFATWLPLAGSWLLMGLELPVVSAAMARMAHATVSPAAYRGVGVPPALPIEAPDPLPPTAPP